MKYIYIKKRRRKLYIFKVKSKLLDNSIFLFFEKSLKNFLGYNFFSYTIHKKYAKLNFIRFFLSI